MPKKTTKKATSKKAAKQKIEEIDTSNMTQSELWQHEGRCSRCGKGLPESFVAVKDVKFCSVGCSV